MKAELNRALNKYKSAVEMSPDAIVSADENGYITLWNPAAERIIGYSQEEAIGRSIEDLVPEEYRERHSRGMERFILTGESDLIGKVTEMEGLKKDGGRFPAEMSLSAIKDNAKWLFTAVIRDITEKKAAENLLRESEKKIMEEVEISKHLFMIAHATANTTDIDRLMEDVVHCLHGIMSCNICLSYLWDRQRMLFKPSQGVGLTREMASFFRTETLDLTVPLLKKAIEDKTHVVWHLWAQSEPQEKKRDNLFRWIEDINAITVIPLIGKEDYLGLLICIYAGEDLKSIPGFTFREKDVMNGISQQVSTALDNARLYKESIDKTIELSRKIETIQTFHDIDRSILSTLHPDEVLETAARLISRVVSCERATIALVDRDEEGFIYKAGFGVTTVPKGAFVPFKDTNATDVIKTGRSQYMANMLKIKGLHPLEEVLLKEGFISHVRVPLTVKGETVGVLSVGARRPSAFTSEDLSILEKLAAQIGIALQNARLLSDLEELFFGTIKTLSETIDAKSPWTRGHSDRVTRISLDIGREIGIDEKELKDLELAGLLHDIGKLGTYEVILDKLGKLTEDEILIIKQHPVKGVEILAHIKEMKKILPMIKYHHEFFDGTGYPEGLKGDNIPMMARILAVADTVDAMGADRPYRKGKQMAEIIAELNRCSGTQFDPLVVENFFKTAWAKRE